ncbi:MAG: AsmA family protein, partial [Burkholderiales bacterium]
MKKIWKISLIASLVLLLLAAAAVTYTVAIFKPNDLKPRVINYFQQKYQRKLVIPGDLGLSLFPVLHIESGQSSLMEKNGQEIFASIESAKVSLSWPALINNRFDVSEVTLDAPSIHLKRFSDGTMNIDDFLGKDGASLPVFDIKGLKIHRATWIFEDQNNHVQLSDANLQVGRLANSVLSEFSFEGDMRANHDEYNLHLALKSPLLFDLNKQNLSLDKIAFSIKGKAKAADKTVENDIALSATGAFMFDGEKKRSRFAAWNLQSRLTNGTEQWNAKVSFSEAVQEGKNWRAADIVSEAEQLTATYRLVSSLS